MHLFSPKPGYPKGSVSSKRTLLWVCLLFLLCFAWNPTAAESLHRRLNLSLEIIHDSHTNSGGIDSSAGLEGTKTNSAKSDEVATTEIHEEASAHVEAVEDSQHSVEEPGQDDHASEGEDQASEEHSESENGEAGAGEHIGGAFFGGTHHDFDEVQHEGEEHHSEPGHAVLFPAFAMTIGLIVYFLLTRYCHALPYTAVMFLIGTFMGIAVELMPDADDHVTVSAHMWTRIDSEVLLLIFLPGLIFKDAMGMNVHLFRVGALQCLIFAFPCVLVGTVLTASVARYVFPYNWSWNLALTVGAILSATDPVAVAALLEEVGAPPRLKVHVAGEALLNDGAAMVFFTIFAERYFNELGKEGIGEEIGWARGFEIFFRMSLGGMCIGVMFGLGILLILYILDRRFSREENIVEVTATAALAYLGYYVAEVVCHTCKIAICFAIVLLKVSRKFSSYFIILLLATAGVIATVASGVTVKFLGRAMLNDAGLLDDFWVLLEHMLNTILFTLGGAVWGTVIANGDSRVAFGGKDWGYLVVLYIMLTTIRLLLFVMVYPITIRIGLKTNWKETVFQVYGGLRGAVGIALAIALDTAVRRVADDLSIFEEQTTKAFGMIGGMAFLTLVINGTTAGPLLIYLGLADSTETRKKIVEAYRARYQQHIILEFVSLLTQHRFRNVNFGLVKSHIPCLSEVTKAQLIEAVERHRDTTISEDYRPPNLQGVLPYLKEEDDSQEGAAGSCIPKSKSKEDLLAHLVKEAQKIDRAKKAQSRNKRRRKRSSIAHLMKSSEPLSAQEMRILFISLLKANYEKMINQGELVDREFLAVALGQSLEFAADNVSNGGSLNDFQFATVIDGGVSQIAEKIKKNPNLMKIVGAFMGSSSAGEVKYEVKRLKIERSMCFMQAHAAAQKFVEREFVGAEESELSEAAKIVINESKEQFGLAQQVLRSYKIQDVEIVTSHKFCAILLNSGVHYISKLVKQGMLKDDEAEHWVKEIEEQLEHVLACCAEDHPGEITIDRLDDMEDKRIATAKLDPNDPLQTGNAEESLKLIQEQLNEESLKKLFGDDLSDSDNEQDEENKDMTA